MRVLVTGGAGYIGSVVTEALLARGHTVVIYDSLVRGHRDAVPAASDHTTGRRSGAGRGPVRPVFRV